MNTPKSKQNRLTGGESFKLFTWYKENQERLLHITDDAIVAEAKIATGIDRLAKSHMGGAREALGIKKRNDRKPKKSDPQGDVDALAEQVATLNGTVQSLLDRVTALERGNLRLS